ncbi:HAD family hydrolase [Schaalia vaccimaxillae]|uniref:HAD family hydrolase n=1 Tax=Schaalia vaccimaxillae TaxID=183916 RepID=UPI0003B7A6BE|nr:HAD family phosphatase [Schaalia vaccimaxillae]
MADRNTARSVLFDVGGVLIASHPDARFVANLIGDGSPALVDLVDQAMWTHRDQYDAGCSDREFWDRVAGDCGKPEVSDDALAQLVAMDAGRMNDPLPEALALVNELKEAGVRLGILSNAPQAIADAIRAAQWSDVFDTFSFSCELGISKPSRGIYRHALEQQGVGPENTVFVDDRKKNVRAAELMGITGLIWENVKQAHQSLVELGLLGA